MPRYAALIYTSAATEGEGTPEEWAHIMEEYNEFGNAAAAAGVLGAGEALESTSTATTVHVAGGKGGDLVTTDGPFAETKEVLGGYYLVDVASRERAEELAAELPSATYGRNEVRPLMELPEMPA